MAGSNTNNPRYADNTTLKAESEEELTASWWGWKNRVKKLTWSLIFRKLRSWHQVPPLSSKQKWKSASSEKILFSWAPKFTADGDCSHGMKRHLLRGKKAMTNLDSVFKSRDITFPTKVCILKAMVLSVAYMDVITGLQRLSAKELMLSNCGAGEDSWESLGLERRSNQSILKKINPEYSLKNCCWSSNTLTTWCEESIHWNRPWGWWSLKAKGEEGSRGWDG